MGFLDDLFNKGSKLVDDAVNKSSLTGEAKKFFEDLEKEATDAVEKVTESIQNSTSGASRSGSRYQNSSYSAGSSQSGSDAVSGAVSSYQSSGVVNDRTAGSGNGGSFEDKLRRIVSGAGSYEIETKLPIAQLENEWGRELYKRKVAMATPESISYVVCSSGERVLYIRYWKDYGAYNRAANRQIKKYFDNNRIKMLDFFGYLPNEESYMKDRIQSALAK